MKRPLEQISQPESKRMSLGEDPSVEHGILAAEDLRWLPEQRSREKLRSPLPHEAIQIAETPATALAALTRQGRGEVRASTLTPQEREELVKAKQQEISRFLQWRRLRWTAMQEFNADALGHCKKIR